MSANWFRTAPVRENAEFLTSSFRANDLPKAGVKGPTSLKETVPPWHLTAVDAPSRKDDVCVCVCVCGVCVCVCVCCVHVHSIRRIGDLRMECLWEARRAGDSDAPHQYKL